MMNGLATHQDKKMVACLAFRISHNCYSAEFKQYARVQVYKRGTTKGLPVDCD